MRRYAEVQSSLLSSNVRLSVRLSVDSKVGDVGIFVRNCYTVQEFNYFNIASSENRKVENLWLQLSCSSKKYIQ